MAQREALEPQQHEIETPTAPTPTPAVPECDLSVAINSPGDRTHVITNALDAVGVEYRVNPDALGNQDLVVNDTPDRELLKDVIRHAPPWTDRPLLFRMRGDPYWGIEQWMDSKLKQRVAIEMLQYVDGCVAIAPHQAEKYRRKTGVDTRLAQLSKDADAWPDVEHGGDDLRLVTLTNCMYPNKLRPIIDWMPFIDDFLAEHGGRWVIGGKGKYSDMLERATEDRAHVEFPGYVDATKTLAESNVMLHLSNFDSFANAILEGAASRLPVIANRHPAFTRNDLPVSIVDHHYELSSRLLALRDPATRQTVGEANEQHVRDRFNHTRIGVQWIEALQHFGR